MDALIPRLRERLSCQDVAVCYITRGHEVLVFDGHPGGGVQVVAGRFREDLCLRAGEAIEAGGVPPAPIDPIDLAD